MVVIQAVVVITTRVGATAVVEVEPVVAEDRVAAAEAAAGDAEADRESRRWLSQTSG